MRSRYAEEMERNRQELPKFPQMYALSAPIKDAADDDEASFLLYGQAAALSQEIPAADLVAQLAGDAYKVMKRMASR